MHQKPGRSIALSDTFSGLRDVSSMLREPLSTSHNLRLSPSAAYISEAINSHSLRRLVKDLCAAVWASLLEIMSKSNTWLNRFWLLGFRQGRQQGIQIASWHAKVHRCIIFAHIREAAYCGPQRPAQCDL